MLSFIISTCTPQLHMLFFSVNKLYMTFSKSRVKIRLFRTHKKLMYMTGSIQCMICNSQLHKILNECTSSTSKFHYQNFKENKIHESHSTIHMKWTVLKKSLAYSTPPTKYTYIMLNFKQMQTSVYVLRPLEQSTCMRAQQGQGELGW